MPVTTITGKNSYVAHELFSRLRKDFVEQHGSDGVQELNGEEVSAAQVQQAVMSQGLFSNDSFVVLREISKNKTLQEDLLPILEEIPSESHLVIYDPELDGRTSFFKQLQKNTQFENCSTLDERALVQWARDRFKDLGGELGFTEAQYLAQRVNFDQWLLANELEKLSLSGKPVTRELITYMVDEQFTETIFALLDAAFSKQSDKAIALYRDMIANRVEPHYVFSMIIWQLNTMVVVANAGDRTPDQIGKDHGISPYVVKKAKGMFSKTNRATITDIVDRAVAVDGDSKSKAGYNMEAAVDALIAQIVS